MFKSMKASLLFFVAGLVIATTAGLTYFAQRTVTKSLMESEFMHAQAIVDAAYLEVSNEYRSIVFSEKAAIAARKKQLRNIVGISLELIRFNYDRFKQGIISEAEAKKLSIEQIKNMRYDSGTGYLWINDDTAPVPRMIMHPTIPALDGKVLDDPGFTGVRNSKENLFSAFRKICEIHGSGFLEYLWPKPVAEGLSKEQPKLSYVEIFKEWGWIIGSGVYMDDINKEVNKRIRAVLQELRVSFGKIKVGKNGYIFLFSGKPDLIIHPKYENIPIAELLNPETGRPIFQELMEAAHTDGVFEYLWDKPPRNSGDFTFRKRAYIKYFEPLDWYICSSAYMDDLEQPGLQLRNRIIIFSIGVLALALIFATLLSAKVAQPLMKLTAAARAIREGGMSDTEIPQEGPTEIKELGTVISQMLDSIQGAMRDKEQLLEALEDGNRQLSASNYQLEIKIKEHARVERELIKLRNHQKNIIDSMPSILVGVDSGGAITLWNKGAAKATGLDYDNAAGKQLETVFPMLAKEIEKARKTILSGRTEQKVRVPRIVNGETRYENITIYPLINNDYDGAVIRLDDVTDNVRIEEMMIQTEKMMSVGGLAAGMAHEINNPLGGILQGTQNIERRLLPGLPKNEHTARQLGVSLENINKYVEERGVLKILSGVRESATRAAAIITNMLNFSRKTDVHRTSCQLDVLVDSAIALAAQDYDLKKKYDFRQIEIVRNYEEHQPYVVCAPTEIEQVLLNLLGNAAQAMTENKTEKPKIEIKIWLEGEYVATSVTDNGPGMEEDVRKRIFEPFFTTKPKGVGTGLGLSVSYFIITENHHGSFSIESTPGNGAKFTFKLPVASLR
ncbi:cache domain-containing protein [Desulfovibrio sp. JC010]|uniref:cache domain-containing protein n=1 Tax=Desulfovibrio sp. JC010 TaxID=2593641 RepID=UPI0013D0E0A7|nr:cache domain-containing protein [Desulfovibrio sp. JC010]NDV28898.1 HAMP domain-containing protein [Desulfovibrio sp. JC010]